MAIWKTIIITIMLMFSSASFAEGSLCDTTINEAAVADDLSLEYILKNKPLMDCIKTKSLFSLPTKVIYLVFGDVTLDILEKMIVNEHIYSELDDFKEELSDDTNNVNIKVVFTAITSIMFILASLIITYQVLLALYESSKSGEFLGKGTNTTWTLIKLSMGATLMLPVEEFGGYSLAQVLVITAGVFASLLAGAGWVLLSLIMNNMFLQSADQLTENDESYYIVDSLTIANNAIASEMCDLERRIFFLEKDAPKGRVSLSEYQTGNEFNKCLTETKEITKDEKGSEVFNISAKRLQTTNFCIKEVYKIENQTACGNTTLKNNADLERNKEKLKVITDRARAIASKVINLSCIDEDMLEKYGKPYQYGYVCAKLDNGEFVFNAGQISYVDKDQDYASYKEEIDSDISKFVEDLNRMAISEKDLKAKDIIRENSSNAVKHLNNGWFAASHYLMDISNKYKEVQRLARSVWQGDFIQYSGDNEYFLNEMEIEEETHQLRIFHNQMEESIESIRGEEGVFFSVTSSDQIYSAVDKIQTQFFSGFYLLNKFLGIKGSTIATELEKENNCFKDFRNCNVVTANPLFEYVKMGNDMLEISAGVVLTLAAIDFVTEFMDDNPKNSEGIRGGLGFVLNFLITLIKLYFLIALLIVYITPMIPFLYFLSYIISWVILIVEGVVTAQIWAFLHLTLSQEEGLSNNVKSGYNLIFTVILKPIVLIISMILSLVASSVAIGIFNVIFGLILSILPISENPNSIVAFAFNLFAYAIYAILLTIVILRITKIIFEIPNKVSQMLKLTQMHGGTGQDWTEVMGRLTAITNGRLFRMLRL